MTAFPLALCSLGQFQFRQGHSVKTLLFSQDAKRRLPLHYPMFPKQYDISSHPLAGIRKKMAVRQILISKSKFHAWMTDVSIACNAVNGSKTKSHGGS